MRGRPASDRTPFAFVQVLPGFSAADYFRVVDALGPEPYAGLLAHLAGPSPDGWRIVQVWRDADCYARFERDRLWPALARTGTLARGSAPPVTERMSVAHLVVDPTTTGSDLTWTVSSQPG